MASGVSGTKGGGGIVNQLQIYNKKNTDMYRTPFPFPQNIEESNKIGLFNFRLDEFQGIGPVKDMDLPVQEVQLDKLVRSQDHLGKETMDNLLKLTISQIQGIKDNEVSVDMPFVIKYKNTYQIQDGHHRLSALWAKGAKKARVKLLDLEKLIK